MKVNIRKYQWVYLSSYVVVTGGKYVEAGGVGISTRFTTAGGGAGRFVVGLNYPN